ncbi:transferrin-binding protein-like solute binding protein [Pelagibacterium sediminicola]|uniref:transferrin-binding protein-like solute binding protein n=1 Tax=Pelagibacterium sediminicola TaxID=2248761 RepID=UPI0013003A77|nr:transferrin-binding protein-like solute binding protein [Pelagibacterium sediminicola]
MRNYATLLAMAVSGTALTACTTAGTGPVVPPPPPPPSQQVYADDAGPASQALANGTTLLAYDSAMSTSLVHNFNADQTSAIAPQHFSIAANALGGVDVTVGEITHSFTAAEMGQWSWQSAAGQTFYEVSSLSGETADVMDSTNPAHHQIWGYWWDEGTGESYGGFATVGTEARVEALVGKANATYTGRAGAVLANTDSFNTTEDMWGDLEMVADFGAGSISGDITNMQNNGNPLPGTVSLQLGNINGTGFSGNVAVSNELLTLFDLDMLDGTYSGKFFGPNAEEIAGVMSLSGQISAGAGGGDLVGAGFFSGAE